MDKYFPHFGQIFKGFVLCGFYPINVIIIFLFCKISTRPNYDQTTDMKHTHKRGLLFFAVFFLILGQFNSAAQIDNQEINLTTAVSEQSDLSDGVYSQNDAPKAPIGGPEQAIAFQQAIEIDLWISAAALYKHGNPGHLRIRDLAHCFMKDNNLGKAKNYGFFLFNIFQAINHVRDFTSYIELPSGDAIKTVQWKIRSLDSGFDCELVKIEPLGKSKRINIFINQSLSADKSSTQIAVTPDTEEGNYRYAIHFKVNDRTYIIDPRLKIQQ